MAKLWQTFIFLLLCSDVLAAIHDYSLSHTHLQILLTAWCDSRCLCWTDKWLCTPWCMCLRELLQAICQHRGRRDGSVCVCVCLQSVFVELSLHESSVAWETHRHVCQLIYINQSRSPISLITALSSLETWSLSPLLSASSSSSCSRDPAVYGCTLQHVSPLISSVHALQSTIHPHGLHPI